MQDFFKKREHVAVYVCDDSDGKGHVRKRKFDGWFYYHTAGSYIKHDRPFIEANGFVYYASIILLADNPLRQQIIAAFDNLADQYRSKNE